MPLAPSTRLGPYEIVGSVGAGGMGDVYKARDTRLERTVAVKVSKEAFEERFRNEALAVAALNHRHICTLYDVGPDYLVMEYVEGKALHGPLPVAETLRLAGQIADALEHAHRHGIIHRDLKPSNILVTKSGVKVLDFGLAKRLSPAPPAETDPTATEDRSFLGTPRYMAPEQIDGKKADERTDIFAFGLVIYEMLTGQRAFDGKSAPGVMAAILERDPTPISALKPTTPLALEQVVSTCLAKDPAERWQSIRELKHALAWASGPERASPVGRRRGWPAAMVAAAVLLGIGIGFAIVRRGAKPIKSLPVRFQVPLPDKASLKLSEPLAVSPDGRKIAFAPSIDGAERLYVRSLDSLDLTRVPGGEAASKPFWSPDGKQIGFAAGHGSLKKVDLSGGPPQTLCRLPGSPEGASWSRDNVILFSARAKLFRVPSRGGEPEPVGQLTEGEVGRAAPVFLPDGRHYLYLSVTARAEDRAIYVGALDSDLRKRVVATGVAAAYSPSGHLLFVRGDTLMAQPFDATRLELSGEPFPVVEQVGLGGGPQYAGEAFFSVSGNGVLAWRPGPLRDVLQLTWFDRSGRKLGTLGEPAAYYRPTLSPDERSLAVCRREPEVRNIWVFAVAGGASRRLTFDAADNCGVSWSPDGTQLAFFSNRTGVREIYQKRVDGSGDDELLLASKDVPLHVEDWSPDGKFLVYNSPGSTNPSDLFLLPMSGAERKPMPFLKSEFMEQFGVFSPNSRWIAYHSYESGRSEVYVKGLSPQGVAGQGKWQISRDGGLAPRWRRDGKELFYVKGSMIMALDVRTGGASFEAGTPKPLFEVPLSDTPPDRPFDVTRDGLRFLVNTPVKPREPIRVLVNWLP